MVPTLNVFYGFLYLNYSHQAWSRWRREWRANSGCRWKYKFGSGSIIKFMQPRPLGFTFLTFRFTMYRRHSPRGLADHGILTVGDECHSCWLNSYKLHGQLAEQPPPSTRSHLQKIFFNKSIFYYCRQRIRLNFFLYSLGFPLSKRTSGILSVIFSFLF